jgi:hypothetical protein
MKRKNILVLFILLSIIYISVHFLLIKKYNFRSKISCWLSIPSNDFIESNNISKINIELDKNDILHFDKLFENYIPDLDPSTNNRNSKFLDYYTKNNKWIKTSLTINGKKYRIKVKSQGRTPYQQKYGPYFSVSVKFRDKPYPFYSERVNFIIYNRIQLRNELLKFLSSKFDLYIPRFELICANIGGYGDYYYFVEERIDENFFIRRNLPMLIHNKKIDGSLIYNGKAQINVLSKKLSLELTKSSLNTKLKGQIKNDYFNFNNSIFEENVSDLKKHIDIDYLARLNAFRIIYGSDGHGFNSSNFEMAYDTINHLFYPILHRDFMCRELSDCQSPYESIDYFREEPIPFWILLDSDSTFREKTTQQIKIFLEENNKSSLNAEFKRFNNYYKSAFLFEFSYINNNQDGSSIIKNIECLEKSIIQNKHQ